MIKKLFFTLLAAGFLCGATVQESDKTTFSLIAPASAKTAYVIKDFKGKKIIIAKGVKIKELACSECGENEKKVLFKKYKFSEFDLGAFASLDLDVAVGDEAKFDLLASKGVLIANGEKNYDNAKQILSDFELADANLLPLFLASKKKNYPSKKDLREFCEFYAFGSIFIALKNEIKMLDCHTQEELSSIKFDAVFGEKNTQIYSNLPVFSKEKRDFYLYFEKLLQN